MSELPVVVVVLVIGAYILLIQSVHSLVELFKSNRYQRVYDSPLAPSLSADDAARAIQVFNGSDYAGRQLVVRPDAKV